jgi:uncharacterized membrane protein
MKTLSDLFAKLPAPFRKLSTQIATVEITALFPVLAGLVMNGQMDAFTAMMIMGSMSLVKFLASFVTQTTVGTYDKTKFVLVPIAQGD